MGYRVELRKRVLKQLPHIKSSGLDKKLDHIIQQLTLNPYEPPYEKLVNMNDKYSRRLNIQHRVVYSVSDADKLVTVWSVWTHYEQG